MALDKSGKLLVPEAMINRETKDKMFNFSDLVGAVVEAALARGFGGLIGVTSSYLPTRYFLSKGK